MTDVQASLEKYRGIREALETAVLPLATSVDGRRFNFQVSLHGLELEPGGYVAIEGDGSTRLGQLLSLELRHQDTTAPGLGEVRLRAGGGEGVVLDGDGRPFHDAVVRRATSEEVGAWLEATRPDGAQLDVGELALAEGVPFRLDAGGFGRHTFLCGQSGSGKTYSLGVLLERLMMETNLRVVVLDPNSDYVRLGEPRVDDERYRDAAASVHVRSSTSGSGRHTGALPRSQRPPSGRPTAPRPPGGPCGVRRAPGAARGRVGPQPRGPRQVAGRGPEAACAQPRDRSLRHLAGTGGRLAVGRAREPGGPTVPGGGPRLACHT